MGVTGRRKRGSGSGRACMALTVAIAVVMAVIAGCKGGTGARKANDRELSPRSVVVGLVSEGDVVREYEGPAEVRARSRAEIVATIPERIVDILVEVGDRVSRGDRLIVLDSTEAERQVSLARANLRLAEAQLKKAEAGARPQEIKEVEAQYEKAKKDYERGKELYSEGAISQEVFDGLKAVYESMEAKMALIREGVRAEDLEAARASVSAARAQLELTLNRLDRMTLRAPFDGTVVSRMVSIGDYAAPGMPLIVLDSVESPQVTFWLPYELVRSLEPGTEGSFTPASESGTFPVVVKNISRSGSSTLLFQVEMVFVGQRYPPAGIGGKVKLPVTREKGLRVPRSAVLQRENKWWVFKVVNGRIKRTEVVVGLEGTDFYLITGGLQAGDRVVVRDVELLKDGEPVVTTEEGVR